MANECVLVVEDNEKNMKLFRDVLQAKGYTALEATSGEEALELAAEHVPDLILMDVHLPGMDGIEALGRIRADARTAEIPVVALTAQAMAGDRERFLESGFDGYISKPVNVLEFIETVGRYCEGAGE
jgi:two-component system cell cycle response regulator DivK